MSGAGNQHGVLSWRSGVQCATALLSILFMCRLLPNMKEYRCVGTRACVLCVRACVRPCVCVCVPYGAVVCAAISNR